MYDITEGSGTNFLLKTLYFVELSESFFVLYDERESGKEEPKICDITNS